MRKWVKVHKTYHTHKWVMCVTCVILTSGRCDALKKRTFDKGIFTRSYFFPHETCVTLTFYVFRLINFTRAFFSLS